MLFLAKKDISRFKLDKLHSLIYRRFMSPIIFLVRQSL